MTQSGGDTIDNTFENARNGVVFHDKVYDGFGTYAERSIHAVLKRYIEPDNSFHEVGIEGSIADICRDGKIYEIQTHALYKLKPKLEKFLKNYKVCVVYPVIAEKTLYTVDTEKNAVVRKRKSPVKESVYNFLPQAYGLRDIIAHPNLSFKVMVLNASEYRGLKKETSRRRGEKFDTVPEELVCEVNLETVNDFIKLLPPSLPEEFGSADYAKAAAISRSDASIALNILSKCNIIKKITKKGNAFIYRII